MIARLRATTGALLLLLLPGLHSGCGGEIAARRGDGLDAAALPEEVRADYQVFAARCSKCHSLSRPLEAAIDTDEYWALYVERMRRQPASGISKEDTVPILRFLHYYLEQQRKGQKPKRSATGGARSARSSERKAGL